MNIIRKFFSLLFEPTDHVWVATTYKGIQVAITQDQALSLVSCWKEGPYFIPPDGVLVGLNPAKAFNLRRCAESVVTYRTILIEMDQHSLTEQRNIIESSGLPYTSIVFTGNRSLHVLICLEEPIMTIDDYKNIHRKICYALNNTPDIQTNNPSQYSRVPECPRLLNGESIEQRLIYIGKRISKNELDTFLNRHSAIIAHLEDLEDQRLALRSRRPSPYSSSGQSGERIQKINGYLRAVASETRPSGSGYSAPCPSCRAAFRDSTGEHLWVSDDGYLHCHAGCSFANIIASI